MRWPKIKPKFERQQDIDFFEEFRTKVNEYLYLGFARGRRTQLSEHGLEIFKQERDKPKYKELRKQLNEMIPKANQLAYDCRTARIMQQTPPPLIGGFVKEFPLFDLIINNQLDDSISKELFFDAIDQTIGVLKSKKSLNPRINQRNEDTVSKGFIFIAMPMDPKEASLEDVHEAIKQVAADNQLTAERADDPQTNERITPKILKSLKIAEYVVADLSFSKPNVYFEAGYYEGTGGSPIYIAKEGSKIEFDTKDCPVIFFRNMKELKEKLDKRFKTLLAKK